MSVLGNIAKAAVVGVATNAALGALGKSPIGGLLGSANNLMSSLRSRNIPLNADNFAPKEISTAQMGADDDDNDWRVRLNIPSVTPFLSSPIFRPLIDSGGLIFPYTPTITINNQTNYNDQPITHSNFQFINYVGSRISEISINGDFYVEDALQAQYWLATVHFLRSVTKMFSGDSEFAGNPPVILYFNAYGQFVFKDVPVVVKSFSMTLPKEVDYITTNMSNPSTGTGGSFGADSTGSLMDTASKVAGIASAFGQTKAANAIQSAVNLANVIGGIAGGSSKSNPLSGAIGGRSSESDTHVPTQSSLNVTLQPIYSRTRVRKFNLETFISGNYVRDGFI